MRTSVFTLLLLDCALEGLQAYRRGLAQLGSSSVPSTTDSKALLEAAHKHVADSKQRFDSIMSKYIDPTVLNNLVAGALNAAKKVQKAADEDASTRVDDAAHVHVPPAAKAPAAKAPPSFLAEKAPSPEPAPEPSKSGPAQITGAPSVCHCVLQNS